MFNLKKVQLWCESDEQDMYLGWENDFWTIYTHSVSLEMETVSSVIVLLGTENVTDEGQVNGAGLGDRDSARFESRIWGPIAKVEWRRMVEKFGGGYGVWGENI